MLQGFPGRTFHPAAVEPKLPLLYFHCQEFESQMFLEDIKLRDSVGMQDFFAPLNVSPSLSFLNAIEILLLFGELRCSSNKRSLWNLQESYCLAREASGHTDSRWSKSSKMERLSQLGSLEKFGLSEGQ